MRNIDDIKEKIPYWRNLGFDTYGTELEICGSKGSVVFTFGNGEMPDHVSFAPYNKKTPSWEQMCRLKEIFFKDEEEAIQIHPKKSEYVNLKSNCLHLWGI